ncbi:hypothetical protein FOA43_003075 [Brettanomyces nanus]|uniref:General negative regulator of transcription subunit n=1 Tax=Eeniella nana TaxID=13502 RepID=A0A875S2Z4_EENNA|nr:uncharacterized protein FOA43_003075 [Brettanomyces nanus]QPG75716.1 hypothetical protein FOA43_003075 [Brettanomyces nanus]
MSQRKLQQEIDRTFKKVNEGIEEFDYLYDKLQESDSQSQKEKLEGDLKKEIKKLQRSREQIKNWMGGNELKDKKQLGDYRKKIEREMERFKEVEKIMKTKAFSNEALASGTLTLDPRQKEKVKCSQFLEVNIDELQRQSEAIEADIDRVYASMKKHRSDSSKQKEIEEQDVRLKNHKYHISMLESVMRHLMNDKLQVDQINEIRDDIEYYVESNDDPNFIEDNDFYEELGLDETTGEFTVTGVDDESVVDSSQESTPAPTSVLATTPVVSSAMAASSTSSVSASPSSSHRRIKDKDLDKEKDNDKDKDKELKKQTTRLSSVSRVSSQTARPISALAPSRSSSISEIHPVTVAQTLASQLSHTQHSSPKSKVATLNGGLKPSTPVGTPKLRYSTVASAALYQNHSQSAIMSTAQDQRQMSSSQSQSIMAQKLVDSKDHLQSSSMDVTGSSVSADSSSFSTSSSNSKDTVAEIQKSLSFMNLSSYTNLPGGFDKYVRALETAKERLVDCHEDENSTRKSTNGTCASYPFDLKLPSFESIFPQLESSLLNCPDSYDADTPKNYVPSNQFVTQPCFPQEPAVEVIGSTKLLKKLELDTLAYCFYYHNQRYQSSFSNVHHSVNNGDHDYLQYIAARELHNRNWRYDKQSRSWFHKDDEQDATDWKFFDYKDTWMVRRKENFQFNEDQEEAAFF